MFNSFARLVTTTTKNFITTYRKCSAVALRSRKVKSTVNPVSFQKIITIIICSYQKIIVNFIFLFVNFFTGKILCG